MGVVTWISPFCCAFLFIHPFPFFTPPSPRHTHPGTEYTKSAMELMSLWEVFPGTTMLALSQANLNQVYPGDKQVF